MPHHHFVQLVLVFSLLFSLCQSYIVTIPHGVEECFYEKFETDVPVSFDFQVTEGGALDIDIIVFGPDQKIIYEGYKQSEGRYAFSSESDGVHRFCFSNRMSTVTDKVINFQIINEEEFDYRPAKAEDVNPIEKSLLQLSDSLHNIQTENKYMRLRERAHRNTSESTNERVLWWSFAETVVLIGLSIWQIYYLRSFFEVRKTV